VRYLTLSEVLDLHRRVVELAGGAPSLRDLGALQSAIAQPRASFGGKELYVTPEGKAAALMLSLIQNHPFADGNKRVGHAAMETFLLLNGFEVASDIDDSERIVVGVAASQVTREELVGWIRGHMRPTKDENKGAT
jgi:death-on-curing protein